MNHHRVQRILHFVRDAGRQTAERRQLARVADRRLHLAEIFEVARDQHDADEVARRRRSPHASAAAARPTPARARRSVADSGPRDWRLTSVCSDSRRSG